MNLADAHADRILRGDTALELAIEAVLDKLDNACVYLSNADRVGPQARNKLKGILKHYAKSPHPFADCVKDNTKRFGADGAKKICAVDKDIIEGTTKWRGKKTPSTPSPQYLSIACPIVDYDDDVIALLSLYAELDVRKVLELDKEMAA